MKDGALKSCVAMGSIVAMYGIYIFGTPDPADGVLFGSVMVAIGALAGVAVRSSVEKAGKAA
jgi:hypothetical protein